MEVLQELYKDASDYEETLDGIDPGNIRAGDPVGIVDPRYLGLSFPSYVFAETGKGLSSAMGADLTDFETSYQNNGLMSSISFGKYDFVHRRVEPSQYNHAEFAVDATNDLDFIESMETYPIFTIGRWHGQDVTADKTISHGNGNLSTVEAALICEIIHSPNASKATLRARLKEHDIDNVPATVTIRDKIKEFENNGVLLGTSIPVKPAEISSFNHALMGMTVEKRDETASKVDMPNEAIMNDLMDKFDGWEMPYIVSGVGQDWADIIAELHLEEITEVNEIAKDLRDIDGIKSTETYLLSSNINNEPLRISDPDEIIANQKIG